MMVYFHRALLLPLCVWFVCRDPFSQAFVPISRSRGLTLSSERLLLRTLWSTRTVSCAMAEEEEDPDDWGTNQAALEDPVHDEETDRDQFIPIFALISLAGLVGTYAYEMVRLYLAGELYLPFLH